MTGPRLRRNDRIKAIIDQKLAKRKKRYKEDKEMGGSSGESYNKMPWELIGASNGGRAWKFNPVESLKCELL